MSCLSNDAPALTRLLTPRFAAALAASVALHAALAAGVGTVWGEVSLSRAGQPLRAGLREAPVPLEAPPAAVDLRGQAGARALSLGPRYYSTRELDVKPGIMTRTQPEYPEAAARRFLAGKVRLQLFIDESGAVERVQTLHADSPLYFEEPALRAFRAARFSPGIKGGKAVKVRMAIEVSFDSPPPPALPERR